MAGKKQFVIYVLIDPRTEAIRYIGATSEPDRRLLGHIQESKRSDTYKSRWIRTLTKLGLAPAMEIVEEVVGDDWGERERWWIAHGKSEGWRLTNATDGGDGVPGYVYTDEVRKRMFDRLRGRPVSEETRRKIGAANKGRARSPEIKQRWSESARKLWNSPGRRKKMSDALRGRRLGPPSAETRRKISEGQIGKVLSAEHRAKLSAAHKGKRLSEATKEKVSAALRGRPVSVETRAKIAEKAKIRWANADREQVGAAISAGMKKSQ